MAKRTTRTREEEVDDADDAQDEVGAAGDGLTNAILVVTMLCLVVAIAMSWWQLGRDYNAGLFGG